MKEFYKASKEMIERKDLSDSEKMLVMVLQGLSERHGHCFATNAKLATMVGWSIDKLRNNLRTLGEKGIVAYELEDGNRRKLTLPQGGVQFNTEGGVQNDTGGCEDLHRGVYESTQGGVQNYTPLHNITINRTDNRTVNKEPAQALDYEFRFFDSAGNEIQPEPTQAPKQEKEKVPPKRKSEIVLPWDTPIFIESWQLWKRYKKEEHRFNYKSEISEQAALKDLVKLSSGIESDAIEIIQTTMAKGWKGFQSTKPQTNGRQQPNTEQLARSLADGIASGKYDITKG